MKLKFSFIVSGIALLAMIGMVPFASAAEAPSVSRVYGVTVKSGEGHAFNQGFKAYISCVRMHHGKHEVHAWSHETGNLNEEAFVIPGPGWANFDEHNPELGKACSPVFREKVSPHIKHVRSSFLVEMPEFSRGNSDEMSDMVSVSEFHIKHMGLFMATMHKVQAAAEKAKWGNYSFYRVIAGGKHSSDMIVVEPYKNWGDYGNKLGSFHNMLVSTLGEDATKKIFENFDKSLSSYSESVYSFDKSLSYMPEKK